MSEPCILSFDYGTVRVGVARTGLSALFPSPLITLKNQPGLVGKIDQLVTSENAVAVVVGLPRGMEGQETEQTSLTGGFVAQLKEAIDLPIYTIDEAVTSVKAREILDSKGKDYSKEDVDAMAASLILQDFIDNNSGLISNMKLGAKV